MCLSYCPNYPYYAGMAQSSLVKVEEWQRKSSILASGNKDRLISAVNKGFDAMAAVLSKDSDPEDVQCVLAHFSLESSLAHKFDKAKDETLRDLVYGLLEFLHVSLNEWTEERNQKKEAGEIPTQTEEVSSLSLLGALIPPCENEASLPMDNTISNHLHTIPNPSFPTEPKEEPIDNQYSLPHDYQISASELMRDEKMFMGEEMDNENTELVTPHSNLIFHDSLDLIDQDLNFTRPLPINSVVDTSQILPRNNQMPSLNALRDEMALEEEEMPNDDVKVPRDLMEENMRLDDVENTGMGDAVNDSLNEQPFEENDSLRTIQPSDVMDYLINFDNEILGNREPLTGMNSLNEASMSVEDVVETAEPEIDGGKRGLSANELIDNEGGGVDDPTDSPKDTSDNVKNEKRRRSSISSRPIQFTEPVDDSDGYIGPSIKKSKADSKRKDEDKRRSSKAEESFISKKNDTEFECPECEFRTQYVTSWVKHLRRAHSTTPALGGLALLCACGKECVSEFHFYTCNAGNTTVIRKKDGPIRRLDDEKATPQCVLCEVYPKTARGYIAHLHIHHNSTLMQNGIYLMCSCGRELRMSNDSRKHPNECNPRQFTLHNLDNK